MKVVVYDEVNYIPTDERGMERVEKVLNETRNRLWELQSRGLIKIVPEIKESDLK